MSIVDATREYLSVDEVARRLAVSRRTIERRIETGDIPAVRLGGPRSAVRVPEAALEAWLWSGGRADAAR